MADGLSRGDAAGSSKLRLLYIMQNGTRVGLSCVCVCAGIHCHLAGYTATHHAVHCLRIPSLILISCIILILYKLSIRKNFIQPFSLKFIVFSIYEESYRMLELSDERILSPAPTT